MDKFELIISYWSESPENYGPNQDVFAYHCNPENEELMKKNLVALFKVQKGLSPCPWRRK